MLVDAGTKTPFCFGQTITSGLVNFNGNYTYAQAPKGKISTEGTTPVGKFSPNRFGLYDMHGNLWEWCVDNWHKNYLGGPTDGSAWISEDDNNYHILRGGSWREQSGRYCRSAYRRTGSILVDRGDYRNGYLDGFRIVCQFPRD